MLKAAIIFLGIFLCSCSDKGAGEKGCEKKSSNAYVGESFEKIGSKRQTSKITCPKCKTSKEEVMPTEICQLSYVCTKCCYEMHPQNGDCCVFCTYGDHKCPSKQ